MTTQRQLDSEARRLFDVLKRNKLRVVFAESCTGGLIAATMTRIPGVSEFLCGSAVVYQEKTKSRWLGVPAEMLKQHGAVSREVAEAMVLGVLRRTPQADVAAAVTGHLGPDAPAKLDGVVYIAVAHRHRGERRQAAPTVQVDRLQLEVDSIDDRRSRGSQRLHRRREAAHAVLARVRESCDDSAG